MVAGDLLRRFVILFMGNVVGQFFFFLALTRLARVLGPSEFGLWNFAQVCMLYLFRASEFGLETIGIRETSRDPGTTRRWITTIVAVRFVLGSLFFGVAAMIAAAGLFPAGTASLVLISSLSLFSMAFVLEWVLEARQEVILVSASRILKGVLFFLAVFLLVSSSEHAERSAFLYVGSLAISIMMVTVIVLGRYGFDWSSISFRNGLAALKKAGPIGMASILSQYSMFASTMVVAYFLAADDLGYFSAANRIVIFLWAYILLSMHRVLLPALSRASHEPLPQYRGYVNRIFRLSALAAIPIGLVGTLSATPLMELLYSSRYEPSGAVFGILLWGFVLAAIRTILEIALIASDGQRRYLRGMIFLSVMYTVLMPLLTVRYGIIGAALAVVGSELAYFCYLLWSSPYAGPLSLVSGFWKPLAGAMVAMGSLMLWTGLSPVPRVLLGGVIFTAIVLLLKGVTSADIALIRSLVRRDGLQPISPDHGA